MQMPTFHLFAALSIAGRVRSFASVTGSPTVNIHTAQGAVVFDRVRHRAPDIQTVVKPNDQRSGNLLHNAIQGAAASAWRQQLRGQPDEELGAAGEDEASLVTRQDVGEMQVADEAVRSLGRWRRQSQLLHRLLLLLVRSVFRRLLVC